MGAPLHGLRVVEFENIGPIPHGAMLLADLGADVVRVARRDRAKDSPFGDYGRFTHVLRGRTTVYADLKDPAHHALVSDLVACTDVLLEGFRPGVMERLGLGPDACTVANPRLVYARMTGWGQDGPRAHLPGHDINYLSLTGALHAIGPADRPVPPLSFVGDYGGGSMFLMLGVLAALWERERTGCGTVVDAAMVDGVAALLQPILELRASGSWSDVRHDNVVDGASPYYRTYECSDGGFMAVGAVEVRFYQVLVGQLGLDPATLPDRDDRGRWDELAGILEAKFREHSRDHWTAVFGDTDACVTPVLTFEEAPDDDHISHRAALVRTAAGIVSAPAPRLGPAAQPLPGAGSVSELRTVLTAWQGAGTT
ncbi:CaiB/BaiF CoA transferase family protein [Rhodococcus sp. NPDC057529]|uniref:CaiB/BaiF CoA transferase family protein n=1 Tax=Rhodococcus sp. NPDC057529 TaxID=3346158 RepID=UPI00366A877C